MLGDLLREARRAADALDPALRARVEAAGESPAAFARHAVASFERAASEEDWASLVSSVRSADDPAAACLATMVRWHLARTGFPEDRNI
jgi:hypothetical protein